MHLFAVIFYIAAIVFSYYGYDKAHNYHKGYSEYSSTNSYVGGDAYNYIINSNYATGYYVLSMGFMLGGVILNCSAKIASKLSEKTSVRAPIVESKNDFWKDNVSSNAENVGGN